MLVTMFVIERNHFKSGPNSVTSPLWGFGGVWRHSSVYSSWRGAATDAALPGGLTQPRGGLHSVWATFEFVSLTNSTSTHSMPVSLRFTPYYTFLLIIISTNYIKICKSMRANAVQTFKFVGERIIYERNVKLIRHWYGSGERGVTQVERTWTHSWLHSSSEKGLA
jgi:hypothetical protein